MMRWLNEPAEWTHTGATITARAEPGTDFWRGTHYGYVRDGGHLYGAAVAGDVTVAARVVGRYTEQYDQAGVMIRTDERTWIKAGVEYVDGRLRFSVVVTLENSSWFTFPVGDGLPEIWLRLRRSAEAVHVHYSTDGERFEMAALAYLPPGREALAGVMCAAPEGGGFAVSFHDLTVEPK